MTNLLSPAPSSRKRVVVFSADDRKVLRNAASLIGHAAGELRDSMTKPADVAGGPRIWPTGTFEERTAKRDYDDSLNAAKALLRIANRKYL